MNIQKLIFIFLLYFLFISLQAQAQPYGKDSLRNAYELAREINKISSSLQPKSDLDAESKKRYEVILGKLFWYANLQDSTGNYTELLLEKLKRYPELNSIVVNMLPKISPYEAFFTQNAKDKIDAWTGGQLKNFLQNAHKEYIDAQTMYNDTLKTLRTLRLEESKLEQSLAISIDTSGFKADTLKLTVLRKQVADLNDSVKKYYQNITAIHDRITNSFNEKLPHLASFFQSLNNTTTAISTTSPYTETQQKAISAAQDQSLKVIYNYQVSAMQPASYRMPSEAEMIDAVAIYIAGRIKQESVMWFFEQISRNAKEYELISTFFPNTIALLSSNEVYEIPNMGTQWRYALAKDFVKMPQNVLTGPWLLKRFPAIKEYRSYIMGTSNIAEGIMNKMTYNEIIHMLYMENKKQQYGSNKVTFNDIIDVLYAVNTELSLPDTVNKRIRLITYEEYRTLTGKELEIMMSLVDLKYNALFSKCLKGMNSSFSFNTGIKAEDIRLFLGNIASNAAEMEKTGKVFIDEINRAKESKDNDFSQVTYTSLNVWNATNNLLTVFDSTVNPTPIFSDALTNSRIALKYTGQLFDVYNQISRKNYAGATQNMLVLIDSFFYGADPTHFYHVNISNAEKFFTTYNRSNILQHILEKLNSGVEGDIRKITSDYNFEYDANKKVISFQKTSLMAALVFDKDRHAVQLVKKLAGFLNDAAQTKDAEQLSKAIESYAMPPGSYKRKRNCWYSADVNAFAGPYLGYEFLDGKTNSGLVYGFSVPIGFSFSKTLGLRYNRGKVDKDEITNPNKIKLLRKHTYYRTHSTFTLTLSIVDIGAVVSYRLQNTDTASALPQNAKWEQFVSPGFHIGYGIGGTPLIMQAGAQYTPLLRRLSDDPGTQTNAYRVYAGLFYDLPLVNMWEKKRITRYK